MNKIWFIITALVLIAVSNWFMYLYMNYRKKESRKIKDFFTLTRNKENLIFLAATLCISVATFAYCYFLADATFLEAFMNAEVALWLVTLGYIDLKEKIIPNELIVTGMVFWAIVTLLKIFVAHALWNRVLLFSLAGAGICGGILFLIALIVKSALGMGDVKMFFVLGLLYGLMNTYSIMLISIFVMAILSIVLLIAKKVTRKTAVPMAPFVALGFLINVLLGA